MMTDAEKISLLIRELEGGLSIEFAHKTGIDAATVSRIISGTYKIGARRDAILSAYPLVNPEWLDGVSDDPGDISLNIVKAKYQKLLQRRDETIERLSREMEFLRRELLRERKKTT